MMTMKATNKVLTAGIIVSTVIAIALPVVLQSVYFDGVDMGSVTAFTLCGLPFFFLQWRLCRVVKSKWVKWIPIGVLCAVAIVSTVWVIAESGSWDSLLGWIGLIFCMAPTAGIFLGWMAHGKKIAFIGVIASIAAYFIANRVPIVQRSFELIDAAAVIVLAAGIYFLIRKPTNARNL